MDLIPNQTERKITDKQLKKLFSDIVSGYIKVTDEKYGVFYFKHLKLYESAVIEHEGERWELKAKKEKLPTEKEQLEFLNKENLWTTKDEDDYNDKIRYLQTLNESKKKLFIQAQKDEMGILVKEEEEKIIDLHKERDELIGYTVEKYSLRKINEEYAFKILYKDKDFEEYMFSREDYDELDSTTVQEIMKIFNETNILFTDYNIRKLALAPFFLNVFYLCEDNPMTFYGKPVLELTYYQNEVFSSARYFKYLLSESKGKPDESVMDDPDEFVSWFEGSKQAEKLLEKSRAGSKDNAAVSIMGASKKDMEHLGLETSDEGGKIVSLSKEAQKKGGSLTMEDLIKLHGA